MPPKNSGIAPFQKVTAALRMLAYGIPADLVDDHLAMGESQAIMCVKRLAVGIVQVFGQEYFVGEYSNFKKIPTHTQDHGDA